MPGQLSPPCLEFPGEPCEDLFPVALMVPVVGAMVEVFREVAAEPV